jgi:hypothetical protein
MTTKGNIRSSLTRARQSEDRDFVFAWLEPQTAITVHIMQARSGYVFLTLERKDAPVTDAEWARFVALWPEQGPAGIVPRPNTSGRMRSLRGYWPRPAEVSEPA